MSRKEETAYCKWSTQNSMASEENKDFWQGYLMACEAISRGKDPKNEADGARLMLEMIEHEIVSKLFVRMGIPLPEWKMLRGGHE